MKLIIQIPCYNEEATLHIALQDLPKKIELMMEVRIGQWKLRENGASIMW